MKHSEFINLFVSVNINGYRETIPESCPKNISELITFGWKQNRNERLTAKEMLEKLELSEKFTLKI